MTRLTHIAAVVLAVSVLAACDSKEDVDLANAAAKAVVAHTPRKKGWAKIDVVRSDPRFYQLAIVYSVPPTSLSQVAGDTAEVARSMLHELIERGKSPSEDTTVIMAGGGSVLHGETGKPRIRWYGWSTYMGATDQLKFEPE